MKYILHFFKKFFFFTRNYLHTTNDVQIVWEFATKILKACLFFMWMPQMATGERGGGKVPTWLYKGVFHSDGNIYGLPIMSLMWYRVLLVQKRNIQKHIVSDKSKLNKLNIILYYCLASDEILMQGRLKISYFILILCPSKCVFLFYFKWGLCSRNCWPYQLFFLLISSDISPG